MKVLHACPWADTATGRTQPVRTAQDRVWDPSSPWRSPKEQALELLDHVLRGRARLTTTHLWLIVSDTTHKTTWPKVTRCRHSREQRRRFCISQRKKVFTLSSTTQQINFYVTKNSKRCFLTSSLLRRVTTNCMKMTGHSFIRPAPAEIEFKNMRFLITEQPQDATIHNYISILKVWPLSNPYNWIFSLGTCQRSVNPLKKGEGWVSVT